MRPEQEDVFMVVTRTYPGGWCKDTTAEKALKRLRGDWRQSIEDYGFAVYMAHPETYCDGVSGAFVHPVGRPPKLVYTHDGRKAKALDRKRPAHPDQIAGHVDGQSAEERKRRGGL